MRYQVTTQAWVREYSPDRHYNVNDTVSIGDNVYQNITGLQGNPATDSFNWLKIKGDSQTIERVSTDSNGQKVFNFPVNLKVSAVLVGYEDLRTSEFNYNALTGALTLTSPRLWGVDSNGNDLDGVQDGTYIRIRTF